MFAREEVESGRWNCLPKVTQKSRVRVPNRWYLDKMFRLKLAFRNTSVKIGFRATTL